MTVREWMRLAEAKLAAAGIESAKLEAQLLASHVLRVDRTWLFAHPEEDFPDLAGESLLQRRQAHEPLAYLLGYREFYGRAFSVDSSVLIPRHETEALVEAALAYLPEGIAMPARGVLSQIGAGDPVASILDLGTGSGILAITLKLERPDVALTAIDVSPEALATASANARYHGAAIRFVLSDAFTNLLGESFDLIVSNPPYIAESEELMPEVGQFEPEGALRSGPTGLEFYERLAVDAPNHLHDDGALILEIGYTQADTVRALFEAKGWRFVEFRRDLSGVDRVLVVRPPEDCLGSG